VTVLLNFVIFDNVSSYRAKSKMPRLPPFLLMAALYLGYLCMPNQVTAIRMGLRININVIIFLAFLIEFLLLLLASFVKS